MMRDMVILDMVEEVFADERADDATVLLIGIAGAMAERLSKAARQRIACELIKTAADVDVETLRSVEIEFDAATFLASFRR